MKAKLMSYVYLILFFIVISSGNSFTQYLIVKGGANYTDFYETDSDKSTAKIGYNFGVNIKLFGNDETPEFSINLSPYFSHYAVDTDNHSYGLIDTLLEHSKLTMNFLEIPVNLKLNYKINDYTIGPYVGLGLGFQLNGKNEYRYDNGKSDATGFNGVGPINLNILAGLSGSYRNFIVELSYLRGGSEFSELPDDFKIHSFSVNFGYQIL